MLNPAELVKDPNFDPSKVDYDLISDGSIHCDIARKFFYIRETDDGKKFVIAPPEVKLDIFSRTSKVIPKWEPTAVYKKYPDLTFMIVDIETLRINHSIKDIREQARRNRIKAIGIRNERKQNVMIQDESESWMLRKFFEIMERKQPDLLIGHNSMWFDLPFIVERCKVLGIQCPMWIGYDREESRFAAAAIAGRKYNEKFRAIHTKLLSGKKVHHLDTLMCAIKWDSVMRKLPDSLSLKNLPVELGLREEHRLDLGIEGIEECYREGDWETLKEYLFYDLEDTHLLANRFVPEIINEQAYFPDFPIQALATVGVGTKWQKALERGYTAAYVASLPDPVRAGFQGAITIAEAGLYRDVVGFDWSGQYPSCMKQYGICSQFDFKYLMLSMLEHAVDYRMQLKYKKERTKAEEEFVITVKAVQNGAYGGCGAKIPFGDVIAAAMITAFARARIRWSIKFIQDMGAKLVLTDTDSVMIRTELNDVYLKYPISKVTLEQLPPDTTPEMLSAVAIGEQLIKAIPEGAKIDLDSLNRLFFVPPTSVPSDYNRKTKFGSVHGRKYVLKNLLVKEEYQINPEIADYVAQFADEKITFDRLKEVSDKFGLGFPDYEGIRKNYIKYLWVPESKDSQGNVIPGKWKVKAKGRFVKRDRTKLEKEFQQKFVSLYADDPASAEEYYSKTLAMILLGKYPIADLMTTRKIPKSDKMLTSLGFGEKGDTVSFYMGQKGEYVQSGAYCIQTYTEKLRRLYQELKCLTEGKPIQEQLEEQLKLC